MKSKMQRKFAAVLAWLMLVQPAGMVLAQDAPRNHRDLVNQYHIPSEFEPNLPHAEMARLLHERVKYVFVLYQENRSFDSYFGTFPGAEGIYRHPAAATPGFTQELIDTNGNSTTIQPFRIGPYDTCPDSTVNNVSSPTTCYAADTDDIDHSHPRMVAKMDLTNAVSPLMDQFADIEELKYWTSRRDSQPASQTDG